jgi:hypothetical protein
MIRDLWADTVFMLKCKFWPRRQCVHCLHEYWTVRRTRWWYCDHANCQRHRRLGYPDEVMFP